MRNIDDAAALFFQLGDDAEKMGHFRVVQRGGRLVKNDDLRIVGNGLGYFHHLSLGDGDRAHNPRRAELNVQFFKNTQGFFAHLSF